MFQLSSELVFVAFISNPHRPGSYNCKTLLLADVQNHQFCSGLPQEDPAAPHLARPSQCPQVSSWALPSPPGLRIRLPLFLRLHWWWGLLCLPRRHRPLCVCIICILISTWKHLEPELPGECASTCHQGPEAGRRTYLRVRPELWRRVR